MCVCVCVAQESMRYAVAVLVKKFGVLHVLDDGKLALTDAFRNEAALQELCNSIGQYRRAATSKLQQDGRQFVLARFPVLAKL